MENIIILMLFTYPGALAERIFNSLAKYKSYQDPDIPERNAIAIDFFISIVVSVATMFICKITHLTAQNIPSVDSMRELVSFSVVSFVISILAGFIWYLIEELLYKFIRSRNIPSGTYTGPNKAVWRDFITASEEYRNKNAVLVVRDPNAGMIACGLVKEKSNDSVKDPGLVLSHGWVVEIELKRLADGKSSLLSGPFETYLDMHTKLTFDLYDGKELEEKIRTEEWTADPDEKSQS